MDSSKKFWSYVKCLKHDAMGIPTQRMVCLNKIILSRLPSLMTTSNQFLPRKTTSSLSYLLAQPPYLEQYYCGYWRHQITLWTHPAQSHWPWRYPSSNSQGCCRGNSPGPELFILVWISHFLKHRRQRVVVGLAWTDVTSGVPQGTVLGPLQFLDDINDLPSYLSSNVRLFAVNCVIYHQMVNDHDHISVHEDLNTFEKWRRDWQMKFYAKKCFITRITQNRNPKIFNYKLSECLLETTNSHPYLGVCITSNLFWSH